MEPLWQLSLYLLALGERPSSVWKSVSLQMNLTLSSAWGSAAFCLKGRCSSLRGSVPPWRKAAHVTLGSPVSPWSEEGKPCALLVPSFSSVGQGFVSCSLILARQRATAGSSCAKAVQLELVAVAARVQARITEAAAWAKGWGPRAEASAQCRGCALSVQRD